MKLLILLLATSSVLCDNFTMLALSQAHCVLGLQYYNSTSFNLLNCYKFNDEMESTTFWGNCTKRCCNPDKVYEQVRSSLESCDQDRKDYNQAINDSQGEYTKQKFERVFGYVLIGILGVSCIYLLIIIVRNIYYRCRQQRGQVENIVPRRERGSLAFPSVAVLRIESESSLNPFRPEASIKWTKERRREEVCPICLLGDMRVELAECEHMVHWECWKEWSQKKGQCALCRSNKVGQLKIFCFGCKAAYSTCRNQDMQRLTTCPKIVCDECKGSNLTQ